MKPIEAKNYENCKVQKLSSQWERDRLGFVPVPFIFLVLIGIQILRYRGESVQQFLTSQPFTFNGFNFTNLSKNEYTFVTFSLISHQRLEKP